MADLLEQIKIDREAGTPGTWAYRPCDHDDWGVVRAGRFWICQARDPKAVDDDFLDECRRARIDPWAANARRIARVPEMESLLLEQAAKLEAAEAMATALSQAEQCMTETLDWSRDCGDPDAECPMQDAHQDDGMQGVRDRASAALAAWKEANK